jgi:transposase-like protein
MVYDDDGIPILPAPGQRWTCERKATIVMAVRHGFMSVEEVCELYDLSPDELLAWERDFDRYGVGGLLAKRQVGSPSPDRPNLTVVTGTRSPHFSC